MRDFNHSVNVLVRAYMNDTLEHNNCYACAVGNLVADAYGYTYTDAVDGGCRKKKALLQNNGRYFDRDKSGINVGADWYNLIDFIDFIDPNPQDPKGLKEIEKTGYSFEEVKAIENAFESVSEYNKSEDQYMLDGLMAVVDVLADIHGIDITAKEEAKKLFVKA